MFSAKLFANVLMQQMNKVTNSGESVLAELCIYFNAFSRRPDEIKQIERLLKQIGYLIPQ